MSVQRYFIYLAYDGTHYHGWQIQPNGISIQECLMKALATFLRKDTEVIGAGRTDAGVHASLMVAHFDYEGEPLDVDKVAEKLNRLLPQDISVYKVCRVCSCKVRCNSTYLQVLHHYCKIPVQSSISLSDT